MMTVISPLKIQLPPGTLVRLLGSWQDYQLLQMHSMTFWMMSWLYLVPLSMTVFSH